MLIDLKERRKEKQKERKQNKQRIERKKARKKNEKIYKLYTDREREIFASRKSKRYTGERKKERKKAVCVCNKSKCELICSRQKEGKKPGNKRFVCTMLAIASLLLKGELKKIPYKRKARKERKRTICVYNDRQSGNSSLSREAETKANPPTGGVSGLDLGPGT